MGVIKQKRYYLFFVLLLISTSACALGQPTGSTMATTQSPGDSLNIQSDTCNNKYYPVKQGVTWTYASTGSPAGPFSFTDTVTEVRADGFTLTSQFNNLTRTQEWACKPKGLQALQLGNGPAANISTQNMSADFQTSDITGLSIPANLEATHDWTYGLKIKGNMAMPDNQAAQADGTANMVFQTMGSETVTVPAGTFEATKVQVNSTFSLNASFQGFSLPVNFSATTITWYATGIGWVKSIENSDFGGSSYSATTELQSYTIP